MNVNGKRIARVFPRRTSATPMDEYAFTDGPPKLLPEIDEVHVSVTFTYDLPRAEALAKAWEQVGVPVLIGGPATGQRGCEFVPGLYVKEGLTITSRGCPNHCWFCSVPKREGGLRELPIHDGWNILDDNLLACSEQHVRDVFAMLRRQPRPAVFSGGLEAKIMKEWHAEQLAGPHVDRFYCAYDTPDDLEPLIEAGKMLKEAGCAARRRYCYVLIGWPQDSFDAAEKRLRQTWIAGFMPYAMLWRNESGAVDPEWAKFQREWLRPAIVRSKFKTAEGE